MPLQAIACCFPNVNAWDCVDPRMGTRVVNVATSMFLVAVSKCCKLLGMHLQLDQYLSGVWHCCVWFARSANPSYVRPMWLVLLLCVWPSATDQVGTDHAACVLLVALVQQVFGRTIQLLVLWQLLVRKGLCRSHARGKGLQWLSTVQAAIASILCLLSNSCRLLSVHLQMGQCLKCHVADKLLM